MDETILTMRRSSRRYKTENKDTSEAGTSSLDPSKSKSRRQQSSHSQHEVENGTKPKRKRGQARRNKASSRKSSEEEETTDNSSSDPPVYGTTSWHCQSTTPKLRHVRGVDSSTKKEQRTIKESPDLKGIPTKLLFPSNSESTSPQKAELNTTFTESPDCKGVASKLQFLPNSESTPPQKAELNTTFTGSCKVREESNFNSDISFPKTNQSTEPKTTNLAHDDSMKRALKEFKFVKQQEDTWIDARKHTFISNETEDYEERRGTYNVENSVLGVDTLQNTTCDTSVVFNNKKRSSIGQRIYKKKEKVSPSAKHTITFKAKDKLPSKKNVTFNENASTNLSKTKRTKLPNFSRIHQRQLEQSENIIDYVERTAERAKVLLSGGKPVNISNLSSTIKKVSNDKENERSQNCRKQLDFKVTKNDDASTQMKKGALKRMDAIDKQTPEKKKVEKKFVRYATPPIVNTNKSQKTFAKTPGKEVLNKSPMKKSTVHNSTLFTPNLDNKLNRLHHITSTPIECSQPSTSGAVQLQASKSPVKTPKKGDKENAQGKTSKVVVKSHPNKDKAVKAFINKTPKTPTVNNIEKKRIVLQGVRLNRRFDLLMKLRNK